MDKTPQHFAERTLIQTLQWERQQKIPNDKVWKTIQNKWTYLSASNEKWQYIITRSDAKLLNVNSALEKKTVLSLVDQYKDIHMSQQWRQKEAGINWKNCADWNRSGWKLISSSVSDGEENSAHTNTRTHKTTSPPPTALRKQNRAIKNIIGLSFLFVCHGGSRKLQLREELRATLLSPLQKTRRRHRPFAYSFPAFEIHLFN